MNQVELDRLVLFVPLVTTVLKATTPVLYAMFHVLDVTEYQQIVLTVLLTTNLYQEQVVVHNVHWVSSVL